MSSACESALVLLCPFPSLTWHLVGRWFLFPKPFWVWRFPALLSACSLFSLSVAYPPGLVWDIFGWFLLNQILDTLFDASGLCLPPPPPSPDCCQLKTVCPWVQLDKRPKRKIADTHHKYPHPHFPPSHTHTQAYTHKYIHTHTHTHPPIRAHTQAHTDVCRNHFRTAGAKYVLSIAVQFEDDDGDYDMCRFSCPHTHTHFAQAGNTHSLQETISLCNRLGLGLDKPQPRIIV